MYGGSQNCLDNRHLYLRTTRAMTMLKPEALLLVLYMITFVVEYQAPNFVRPLKGASSVLFR